MSVKEDILREMSLGVKQAAIVLRYIAQAREQDIGVIFISHNVHHAYAIGDRFTVLNHGRSEGTRAGEDDGRWCGAGGAGGGTPGR